MINSYELDKYTNKIGKWWLENKPEEIFYAQIEYKNGNYILKSDVINIDMYRTICKHEKNGDLFSFCVYGKIGGVLFSMINCHAPIKQARMTNQNDTVNGWECGIEIVPSEIVFGGFYANDDIEIVSASVDFENIDEFLNIDTYDMDIEKGLSFVVPKDITVQLIDFSIIFSAQLITNSSRNSEEFINQIETRFLFPNKINIKNSIEKIAKFRMLLSLLKLNYIGINSIEIVYEHFEDFTQTFAFENRAFYHMNYSVDKIEEDRPMPFFRLNYDNIADVFESAICKWYDFTDEAEPIVELFYQILIKQSFDINKFLNLAQALEVYSNAYRNAEARLVLDKFPNGDGTQNVRLFHKIYDLLLIVETCFNFDENEIKTISHWIANTRNYYTHYGTNSKKKALSSYDMRSPVSRLMTYLLTILIYLHIGIPIDVIRNKFYHTFYKSTLKQVKDLIAINPI